MLRAFDRYSGNLLWEVLNFTAIARSPDNTLWGYSLRKAESVSFTARERLAIQVSTGNTESGAWPLKTGVAPSNQFQAVVCDLVKVTSDGTKTITHADFWTLAEVETTSALGPFSSCSRSEPLSPGPAFYDATDSGWGRPALGHEVPFPNTTPSSAIIYVENKWAQTTTTRFTIPAQPLVPSGTNPANWNFRIGTTTVQVTLYGTASALQSAIASLPGVSSCTVTGGPLCHSDVDVVINWTASTNNLSNVWLTQTTGILDRRCFWDWSTGRPALISRNYTPVSVTSDSSFVLRGDQSISKRGWGSSAVHPWQEINSTDTWNVSPWASRTQTLERTRNGSSWNVVPILSATRDVRAGKIVMSSTAVRVPVIEPSGIDFDTHVTLNESDGSVAQWHQSFLYGNPPARLDTDGSIAVKGTKYRYAYGMLDHIAPPTIVHNDQLNALRHHSGHAFSTGTGHLYEPFGLKAVATQYCTTGDVVYTCDGQLADYVSVPVEFSGIGVVPSIEGAVTYQSTSPSLYGYWSCSYIDVPNIFGVPAHRRETYNYWGSLELPLPMNCEWRLLHKTGGITHFATAWMAADVTQLEVESELNAWYGEGSPGVPTITLTSVVEPNTVQDQPFFQYLPLSSFQVKTDTVGIWAPRGRTLCIEVRNGTFENDKPLAAMNRSNGEIIWQRWVGKSIPRYGWFASGENVGGLLCYSNSSQVVVSTLCKPEPPPECGGTATWESQEVVLPGGLVAIQWVLVSDDCVGGGTPVSPTSTPLDTGEQATTNCDCE